MITEGEEFAVEDEAQKRIEALNSQVNDAGGKLSDDGKKSLLVMFKETADLIDENGALASAEGLEDKLQGSYNFTLTL